jgi:hypothetical protein
LKFPVSTANSFRKLSKQPKVFDVHGLMFFSSYLKRKQAEINQRVWEPRSEGDEKTKEEEC